LQIIFRDRKLITPLAEFVVKLEAEDDTAIFYNIIQGISIVADPDPGSGAFLPPGSGIWIQDEVFPGSWIQPLFLVKFSSETLLCYLYETGLLLKLTPETIP
jgi:hypothetical protein